MENTNESMKKWDIAKVFTGNEEVCMGTIDFHSEGQLCVFSREDGVISIVNCLSGEISKILHSKTYGVDVIRYSHHPDCIIYSSGRKATDCAIRYHSTYDNQYLRYFQGHTGKVTSLAISPSEDEFLSASLDGTIRSWDIRGPKATGVIQCPNIPIVSPCVAYDPEGLVFAVHTDDQYIRLFDARNQEAGPFCAFTILDPNIISAVAPILTASLSPHDLRILDMKFSSDGNRLMVSTNSNVILELDSFEGHLVSHYANHQNSRKMKLGSAYSPDGKYLASGSSCGDIFIYNVQDQSLVTTWKNGHIGPIHDLQFNPTYALLGSVHANAVLWTS